MNDWLTLTDVAERLGVHPSTIRLWSDKGLLPVHRTSGGHRRYLLPEVELWQKTARQKQILEPDNAMQIAMSKVRLQISEGSLQAEPWYQKLDADARAQYRQSGAYLVRGIANQLASSAETDEHETFAIGYEYASRAHRYGLNAVEATRAFLFFRNSLLQALINTYEDARVPPGVAWGQMLNRLHTLTDQVLLNILEVFQSLQRAR